MGRIKSLTLTTLAAFLVATLLYVIYIQINGSSHGEVKRATTNNIDTSIGISPVAVIGKVIDDKGTTRNLRRDSTDPTKEDQTVSVPGTDYAIEVIKVLKGNVEPGSQIKVAVAGGSYKGENARLSATLKKGEEYIFALAPSFSSPASYYGMIEPYIFQLKNNKIVAVTNDDKLKAEFQETNATAEELIQKFNK